MDEFWKHRAIKDEENNVDPDDAKSTPCFACKLPIFSTPVVELLPSKRLLHRRMRQSPRRITRPCPPPAAAPRPAQECGSVMRTARTCDCPICALFAASGFTPAECASLPNAIVENHRHALRLSYHLAASFRGLRHYECEICGGDVASLGVYFCGKCRYYVHIKCAMADPRRFKSDAKFADMLHFPLEDEYTSVVRFILENASENDWHPHQIEGKFSPEEIHEHPLI